MNEQIQFPEGTTFGSIGLTTGLDPAMTLGCGGYGGNITSDNISPKHLLNVKRLAYEIAPVANRFTISLAGSTSSIGIELSGFLISINPRSVQSWLLSRSMRSVYS